VISELKDLDDLRALERLFAEVWERPGEPPIGSDVLMALVHSGNYVAGARLDDRIVGGLVGWFGGPPPDHLHLHSHILGVVAGSQVHGLGFDLKQHQRSWCLARGVSVIEWTFVVSNRAVSPAPSDSRGRRRRIRHRCIRST